MNPFKKKIKESEVIYSIIETNQNNARKTFSIIEDLIEEAGCEIANKDEAEAIWFLGLLVLDVQYANQVFDRTVASRLIEDVGHFIDFQANVKKEWPPKVKEMYDFYTYEYLVSEQEFFKNNMLGPMPIIPTVMALIIHMIFGYAKSPDDDILPPDADRTAKLLSEILQIALDRIGTLKTINNTYKIIF